MDNNILNYVQSNKEHNCKNKLFKMFILICLIHFLEHCFQIVQLHVFNIPRVEALGVFGYIAPDLIRNRLLHFDIALLMQVGFIIFNFDYFTLIIQAIHVLEHTLQVGLNWSIGEIWFPRAELHFYYNLVVGMAMLNSLRKMNCL